MANRRLDSWKEIAAHLGRSVRTVQRWEKENGLPVHRVSRDGLDRVYALTDELERWMHSAPAPDAGLTPPDGSGTPAASPAGPPADAVPAVTALDRQVEAEIPAAASPKRRNFPWKTAAAIALVLLAAAAWRLSRGAAAPAVSGLRMEGHTLTALDRSGRKLWQRTFPEALVRWNFQTMGYPLPAQGTLDAVEDLDGDGTREILVATQSDLNPLQPAILHCLDERGEGLWHYQPGRPIVFGDTRYDGVFMIRFFLIEDFERDGRKEILLLAYNHSYFPCNLTLLECDGRPRGQYVHSGHFLTMATVDLDGDGRKEILGAGINNGYLKGSLAVLDDRGVEGASPQPDTPDHRCADAPPGRELYYILFPRDCVNRATENYGRAQEIRIRPDSIGIYTGFILRPPCPAGGGVTFRLDRQLRLAGVEVDPAYRAYHDCLEANGILDHPFLQEELGRMEPILYWNGERYTPEPTRNLRASFPRNL